LLDLASSLGSDVAFFVSGATFAIGRGRGERLQPITGKPLTHVVVTPEERLSTSEVYAGFAASREAVSFDLTPKIPSITIVQHALSNGSLGELAHGLWNDLEREAIRRCPVMASIRTQLLAEGCLAALVSGSGSSVFGLCHSSDQAQAIVRRLRLRVPRIRLLDIIQTA
jgi:4-diphosphocytidyl-2-C-methyl-D-erythritol kinase